MTNPAPNPTSIATVSLSGDLAEKLQAIAAAGFDAVEVFENDFLTFDGGPREVGRMVADLGMRICAFQPFRDFEGMPEPLRARGFARAERKFAIMNELGTDLMLICSNVSPQALGGIDRAAADFHELGELAARFGVRVGYEALAWGRHVNDYRDAWEIVRRADHERIGVILDSFHTLARPSPLGPIASIPGDRIFLVQLADAPKLDMDVLSWSRHFRCFPGQGDLAVADFVRAVAQTGYAGPLSHEIFNDQFRAGSARRLATDGMRSLIALSDQTRPHLPPRAPVLGVEFIEFALDEEIAAELSSLFSALGFRQTGTHVSKSVTRWSQGDINLLLNTEKDGFAQSHAIMHGPGVCAIALRVDDVGQAMARAAALKIPSFEQPVGPGELQIPAIRGVGGSLIYFTQPTGDLGHIWEKDFAPVAGVEAPPQAALLQRVDHISQSMDYEEMLSWLLFYSALFALDRIPQLAIADPGGLVESRPLVSANQTLRIVLNGSQATRTLSSRFVSEHFGSGVQHIAFDAPDIFAAVGAMRAAGLSFLDIPENYYEDLEARHGLDPDFIDRLRDHHILYDRDGEAEFLQVYTHVFAQRFFFEIVERRGGYGGFGAVNAPVRLASQAREARPVTMPRSLREM
ncbi:bifunctional sugar phosphate isomerase/epimerase/4-hydroxyphenylpyruvate dioxygenase family protein [Bosea sp. (in: a-proteobacteria)]|uniref:bifunctional sugar phosphate isomerase/epimerase/4-hydroxyphenylpyruvate dioxygenase family protein n=1 Tax=Bosea sp. (in: a-proteobacteria) TaxID=1871050 RepID=UPI00273316A4|nr:sugar phosphate isomerase/epimerase and 4-hydroxyphenylpyruvate domain-containing protein [Bosea sp. (in: a-proteobacteria)]MDP3409300.1 TIM barrel protein [Bosea sp. (in: a-proteobacteria)]